MLAVYLKKCTASKNHPICWGLGGIEWFSIQMPWLLRCLMIERTFATNGAYMRICLRTLPSYIHRFAIILPIKTVSCLNAYHFQSDTLIKRTKSYCTRFGNQCNSWIWSLLHCTPRRAPEASLLAVRKIGMSECETASHQTKPLCATQQDQTSLHFFPTSWDGKHSFQCKLIQQSTCIWWAVAWDRDFKKKITKEKGMSRNWATQNWTV